MATNSFNDGSDLAKSRDNSSLGCAVTDNGRNREENRAIAIQQDVKDCIESILSTLDGNLQIDEQISKSKEPTQNEKSKKRNRKKSKHHRGGGFDKNAAPKFFDVYQVIGEIGHGRFGVVNLCVHKITAKQYAVKEIRIGPRRYRKNGRMLVEKETKICRRLRHPNVVTLVENFVENRVHRLVFEFISGGELRYDIVQRTTYSELDASHCIGQILQGVAYLHRNEIIHRDLKPKNILLTNKRKDVVVKIADFGLAVEMEGQTKDRFGIVGTLVYSPPEVYRDDVYGTPVDMWACGALLYLMLFGRLPFDGRNVEEVYDQIDYGLVFPTKEQGVHEACEDAKDLIRRMIDKDQDNRITAEDALNHPFLEKWQHHSSRFRRDIAAPGKRKFKSVCLGVMFAMALFRQVKLARP